MVLLYAIGARHGRGTAVPADFRDPMGMPAPGQVASGATG